jgi:MFS family permease
LKKAVLKNRPPWILPVIVLAQFAGTSLWFAGNAVMPDLQRQWHLAPSALGTLTAAVQLGFIAGTLAFAWFAWADRFPARILFCVSALLGAAANLLVWVTASGLYSLIFFRFLTGFFLAGIYPVGMKIAVAWYRENVGEAIGYLVGALVLGTAFPHLLKALGRSLPWPGVVIAVSVLSALGGILLLALVPEGPHLPPGRPLEAGALGVMFRSPDFRRACFGYFGHMWELYTFWTFVPILLVTYAQAHFLHRFQVSLWSFAIIAAGSSGCVAGGLFSRRLGSLHVAAGQLTLSGLFCLLAPLLFFAPPPLFFTSLVLWGIFVVGDSPQFSALAARTAPPEKVGSALTIMNCLGFALTIISIQAFNYLRDLVQVQYLFPLLGLGPLFGLSHLWKLRKCAKMRAIGKL